MAAQEAAVSGCHVVVLEGGKSAGAKLLLSGGGRCNATNAVVTEQDFCSNAPRTVRHVLEHLRPAQFVTFLERHGVRLSLEEDGKYFTAEGRAEAVLAALLAAARQTGVRIEYNRRVQEVVFSDGSYTVSGEGFEYSAPVLLVTTGGLSYPATGSTGFGYSVARRFGHTLVPTVPALSPLLTDDKRWTGLSGVAVPCRLTFWLNNRKAAASAGPILFTHFGFSGPAALDLSRHWSVSTGEADRRLTVDFLPELPARDLPDASAAVKKTARTVLSERLPARLAAVLLELAGIDAGRGWPGLNPKERRRLQETCQACELPVSGVAGWGKAEVTAGGVDLGELAGATLESRLQPGLFFAGEVLDVDGRVGGFNLHWAWASGVAAARGAVKKLRIL